VRLFLFDIDGTLLLSGGAGARALDRAFLDELGIADAMAGIHPGGKTDPALLDEVCLRFRGRPAAPDEAQRVLARYVGYLEDEVARSPSYRLMPWVIETLDRLSACGDVLGLATGNIEAGARIKLRRAGLSERFGFGGFGCDSPLRAELVACAYERGQRQAGRRFGTDETYVVGDTPLDIAAARAVGVRAVAVATGAVARDALAAHTPDLLLDDLSELLPALDLLGSVRP
jgi:phosphoglycolate phosphatase-like HAD superfamily hydrolase